MLSPQTLSFIVLLGACKGLTLTYNENIDLAQKTTAFVLPSKMVARNYPLDDATGINVHENIQLAFTYDTTTATSVDDYMYGMRNGKVTITCTGCDTSGDVAADDVRIFPLGFDPQVSIGNIVPTGKALDGSARDSGGFVILNPMKPLLPGVHTVTMAAAAVGVSDSATAAADKTSTDTYTNTDWQFTVQASCTDAKTEAECEAPTATPPREDCMWTGSKCEPHTIVVSGVTADDGTSGECTGASGTEYPADGVLAGCGEIPVCLNGIYTSRGMYNGKPVYSQDWDVPLAHGGSRIQYEDATSATLTGHRGNAGWIAKCGGAVRFTGATSTTQKNPLGSSLSTETTGGGGLVWTKTSNFGNEATAGDMKVAEASCITPDNVAPYAWATKQAAGYRARGSFGPDISCAPGYSGSAKATNCPKHGVEYTVSGCTKNSSRRRRRKHSHPWSNNKNDAAWTNPWAWFR